MTSSPSEGIYAHQADVRYLSDAINTLSLSVKEYSVKQDIFIHQFGTFNEKLEKNIDKLNDRIQFIENEKVIKEKSFALIGKIFKASPTFFIGILLLITIGLLDIIDEFNHPNRPLSSNPHDYRAYEERMVHKIAQYIGIS